MGYSSRTITEVNERIRGATVTEVDELLEAYKIEHRIFSSSSFNIPYEDEVFRAFLWQLVQRDKGDLFGVNND